MVMAVSGRSSALEFGCAEAHPRAPHGAAGELRRDLRLIAEMIDPEARVLDIGCGDGALLAHLVRHKKVDGRGMELSQSGVNSCVGHGLSVIQGDADRDLEAYPTGAFDFVVLSQTLQATRQPRKVLETLVRIGRRAIVSFPNFGFWRIRLHLLFCGRMPMSHLLAHPLYETPNIHLCTIRDFVAMCDEIGVRVEQRHPRPPRAALFPRSPWRPGKFARRTGCVRAFGEPGRAKRDKPGDRPAALKHASTPDHRDSPCGAGV
jgi:methionine biosynthesis protein MetW